jgi:phi13 family phage major tail protein
MAQNIVEWGISNLGYSVYDTVTSPAPAYNYGEVKKMINATGATYQVTTNQHTVYGDNKTAKIINAKEVWTGNVTVLSVADQVLIDIFKWRRDNNGILVDSGGKQPNGVALVFQIEGDVNAVRHIFWDCTLSLPNVETVTDAENVTTNNLQFSFTAKPRITPDGLTHGQIENTTANKAIYDAWITTIQEPDISESATETTNQPATEPTTESTDEEPDSE